MRAKFIYEKFTDESDPIKDMGIGIKFARIKLGDVIVVKENIDTINHNLKFRKSEHGYSTQIGAAGFVSHIYRNKNILELITAFFPDAKIAKKASEEFLKSGTNNFILTYGKTTLLKWNKYFDVL
jgi:hypothetical protein